MGKTIFEQHGGDRFNSKEYPGVKRNMPNPSKDELKTEEFNAIWNLIKTWDINVPEYYNGYTGANGSHVKLILDVLYPVLRNEKINKIIK